MNLTESIKILPITKFDILCHQNFTSMTENAESEKFSCYLFRLRRILWRISMLRTKFEINSYKPLLTKQRHLINIIELLQPDLNLRFLLQLKLSSIERLGLLENENLSSLLSKLYWITRVRVTLKIKEFLFCFVSSTIREGDP